MDKSKKTSGEIRPAAKGIRQPDWKAWLLFGGLTLAGAGLDLWSKKAVFQWLSSLADQRVVFIDGFLSFIPRLNLGAAFSIMEGQRVFLVSISLAAFLLITILFALGKIRGRLMQTALGLMNAGIIGNMYDRMFNDGMVRDFIQLTFGTYQYPTFNVADSLLCIGVGLMLIVSFTSGADSTPAQPKTEP